MNDDVLDLTGKIVSFSMSYSLSPLDYIPYFRDFSFTRPVQYFSFMPSDEWRELLCLFSYKNYKFTAKRKNIVDCDYTIFVTVSNWELLQDGSIKCGVDQSRHLFDCNLIGRAWLWIKSGFYRRMKKSQEE